MSSRIAAWLAWSMWVLTVLATTLTLLLASLNEPTSSLRNIAVISLLVLAFSTVGALVASRRSGNPIGWLFCLGAVLWIVGELALEYGVYALITDPDALPAGMWAAWLGTWARGVGWFLIVVFLLLLFPTGRLPSPRWRPVLWGAAGYIAFFTLVIWLSPESFDLRLVAPAHNPLGLNFGVMGFLLEAVVPLTFPLLVVAGGAAVIVRFHGSRGDERQQLKWFAYAVAVMIVVFVLWFPLELLARLAPVGALAFTVPLIGLPIATGIAILKYRLYDIDVIVNRTLVYGALTATLVALYFGGIVVLQRVFVALTGERSTLAVVGSTLLIAALFNPLRRRTQGFIDRRFYRRKYDAAKTLQDFSAKLRDETDLDALNAELVTVVRNTMQPAHVSLWLRPETASKKDDVPG
jgi:hypothetical protein